MEKLKAMHADRAQEMAFIKYVEKHFDVRLENEPENDIRIEDDFEDTKIIRWIEKQLEKGNEWAWCQVKVTVTIGGLEACEYLGGCSYRSESDFKKGGYYSDMLLACLEELFSGANEVISKIAA